MPPIPPAVAVLDVNDTLSNLDGLVPRFQEAGVDAGILRPWFAATLRDGFALTAAGGYADFSEIAIPTLTGLLTGVEGLVGTPQEVAVRIVDAMAELDLHGDVAAGLKALHDGGVRIVTLSNGSPLVANSLLRRAGVRDLVEQCLSVSDAGCWKPAAQAYAHAAARCEVEPGRLALIAVHPWDIDGALRAGLRAAWLCRGDAAYPPYLRAPEATGHTLSELAGLLTRRAL